MSTLPEHIPPYVEVQRKQGDYVFIDKRTGRKFSTLFALEDEDGRSYDPPTPERSLLDDQFDAFRKASRASKGSTST